MESNGIRDVLAKYPRIPLHSIQATGLRRGDIRQAYAEQKHRIDDEQLALAFEDPIRF